MHNALMPDRYLSPEQKHEVERITKQRVAEYNFALMNGAGADGYEVGSTKGEQIENGLRYAHRLRHVPVSEPWSDDEVALLVAASTTTVGLTLGQVRTVVPNNDADTSAMYPWQLRDNSAVKVSGWVPRDLVYANDQVWVPGHGFLTVTGILREGDRIAGINTGGTAHHTMWFQTVRHTPYGLPEPGQWAMTLSANPSHSTRGRVGRVTGVDKGIGNVHMDIGRGEEKNVVLSTRAFPLQARDGRFVRGTIVQPHTFLSGAHPDFIEHAKSHPAVVEDYLDEKPRVRSDKPWGELALYTVMPQGIEVLGHMAFPVPGIDASKINLGGPQFVAVDPSVEDKPEPEGDGVYWKSKYHALVEALRREAEERDWCSEFDDFCEDNDIPSRPVDYDVNVTMEVTLDAGTADEVLAAWLNSQGVSVDVRSSAEVEHRATVRVETTRSALRDGAANDLIEESLRENGFRFDSFDIEDWDRA